MPRARRVLPPSKKLVEYYNVLVKSENWRRSIRDIAAKKTPIVNERTIEIITALFCYEKAGTLGVSLKHLRFLIPNISHAQLHRLGDFWLTRVDSEISHYRYRLNDEVVIL